MCRRAAAEGEDDLHDDDGQEEGGYIENSPRNVNLNKQRQNWS